MGIDATLAYLLATSTRRFALRGVVCTLGVQQMRSEESRIAGALAAAGLQPDASDLPFFRRLGFDAVESVDVSPFEGCTHILDLNRAGVPADLRERFDVIYNGGTLEHVFDIRAALSSLFQLLRVGGVVIHVVPVDGWPDHGFYQISPTLLIDYYMTNEFEVLEASMLDIVKPGSYLSRAYRPDTGPLPAGSSRSVCYAAVRKTSASTHDRVPTQRYYASVHGGGVRPPSGLPYQPPLLIEDGIPVVAYQDLHSLPQPTSGDGLEWQVEIPGLHHLGDAPGADRSPLILFEDGEPIGPPHSPHAEIRAFGGGRYSHWGGRLHFSSARNDDPRGHLYTYAIAPLPTFVTSPERYLEQTRD